jgi:hypothetical protein
VRGAGEQDAKRPGMLRIWRGMLRIWDKLSSTERVKINRYLEKRDLSSDNKPPLNFCSKPLDRCLEYFKRGDVDRTERLHAYLYGCLGKEGIAYGFGDLGTS